MGFSLPPLPPLCRQERQERGDVCVNGIHLELWRYSSYIGFCHVRCFNEAARGSSETPLSSGGGTKQSVYYCISSFARQLDILRTCGKLNTHIVRTRFLCRVSPGILVCSNLKTKGSALDTKTQSKMFRRFPVIRISPADCMYCSSTPIIILVV